MTENNPRDSILSTFRNNTILNPTMRKKLVRQKRDINFENLFKLHNEFQPAKIKSYKRNCKGKRKFSLGEQLTIYQPNFRDLMYKHPDVTGKKFCE